MKKGICFYAIVLASLCMILALASCAGNDHRRPRSGEIRVENNTDSQVTVYITTEKFGRKYWSFKPHTNSYAVLSGVRTRVRGDDDIEVADWGKAKIDDVAEFYDGMWKLNLRDARHKLR